MRFDKTMTTADFEPARTPDPELLGVTAARGVGLLVGRTLGLQLLTAGVTVVLARLLTPADYGLFAIALAVQLVGQRAAELGLPAALVRLDEEPSREIQAAVSGVMLVLSTGLTALVLITALVIVPALSGPSKTLTVIAVAVSAMPFYAARATPMVLLERKLKFGSVAIIETADTIAFNLFALGAALIGLGAFSLAGAVPAGAIAGMVAAWLIQPFARRPTIDLESVGPLTGFGFRVSALQGIYLIKELGFVGLLAAIGGTPLAGFYAMAKRLFSFPIALTSAVGRVAFPALSRESEHRASRAARIMALTAIASGLPLALVAGSVQPLIVVLLGDTWLPTTNIVLIGSIGMMFTASAIATMVSYVLAEGKPNVALIGAIIETAVLCALAVALIGSLHETGVGIAIAVATVVATLAMAAGVDPRVRRSLISVVKATLIAAGATCAAQILNVSNDIQGLAVAIVTVLVVWLTLEAVFARRELRELISLARPMLRKVRNA